MPVWAGLLRRAARRPDRVRGAGRPVGGSRGTALLRMSATLRQAAVNFAAVRVDAHRIRRQAARLGMAVTPNGSISVGLPVPPAGFELIGHQIRGVVRGRRSRPARRAGTGRTNAGPAPHDDVILATGNPACSAAASAA